MIFVKEIQVEIIKLHALIQNLLFKEIPLLMLNIPNKALFIFLINQNEVLCIRMKQSLQNYRESVS